MADKQLKPIIIGNFQKGIAPSPFVDGFADMRNLDVSNIPGGAKLNFAMQKTLPPTKTTTFTVDTSTEILTVASTFQASGFAVDGRAVTVSSSGTLPAPLAANTTYFLIDVTATTVKIATTLANALAGTAINITTTGTGTHTITSVNMNLPKYAVFDNKNSVYYVQDSIGQIWKQNGGYWYLVTGNTVDNTANGNGLILFNNYLLAFRDTAIDVYGNLGGTPSWTNGWQNILGGTAFDHVPYFSPLNGIVYWSEYKFTSNGGSTPYGASGLGSLLQTDGATAFDPSSAGTYTFSSAYAAGDFSLQLPTYQKITTMILLANKLMIGTDLNLIYPWDTVSATFDLPIVTPENSVSAMTNQGNILYFACGQKGNIYFYNGYQAQKIGQIPVYLTNYPFNAVTIKSMIKHNGILYFNVGGVGVSGVWSLNPETKVLLMELVSSSESYGTLTAFQMGLLVSFGNDIIMSGWFDSTAGLYGLDRQRVTGDYYTTNSDAYMETQIYNVGQPNTPRKLQDFLFNFSENLASGQSVKIYSRPDFSSAYTLEATCDFATFGAVNNVRLPFGKDFVNVQFKVTMTTASNSATTPKLNSITIY